MPNARFVLDKGFDTKGVGDLLPGYCIESRTTKPDATYKGSYSEDEDYAHVLQLAFERHACVLSSDAAMIEKARRFHSLVVGHKRDRCMDGVIVVPAHLSAARRALKNLSSGTTRIKIPGYNGKPFLVTIRDVDESNLGVNLRAASPTAVELCSCPWAVP